MSKQKLLVVGDAETDPFMYGETPAPFVWGYYDGLDFDYFWGEDDICTEEFIDFIREKEICLYMHNGGKFDFFFLLKYIERKNIRLINGRISQATIGKCTLRDSYNILPVPLAAYKKDNFEYWKMKKEFRKQYKAEILKYLESDCINLYEMTHAFENRYGRKLTLASAAMGILKETIQEKTHAPFEPFNETLDNRFRKYYYGGRCEALEKGVILDDLEIYDINSAYPKAMTENHPDPTYVSFYIDKRFPTNGIKCYFAHIKATSKGALPWRLPPLDDLTEADKVLCRKLNISLKRSEYQERKLLFPNDNAIREYFVTGWEIDAGLETKTLSIKEILSVRIPDKVLDFSEYVEKYYGEKLTAKLSKDKIMELLAKLFLNSPYGKFAINPRGFKEFTLEEFGEIPTIKNTDENGKVSYLPDNRYSLSGSFPDYDLDIYERKKYPDLEEYENPEDYIYPRGFINVTVAASITGYVRAFLWRSICESERPIYCDTDSIMCRKFHGEVGNELGQWKLEGKGDLAYIGGRKMYALRVTDGEGHIFELDGMNQLQKIKATQGERWKVASKGARLTPGEIERMVRDGEIINWENAAPTFSLKFGTRFLNRNVKVT